MAAVLSDIRVVAIEQYGAGPYGSLHLAELGADVIKIEQPPGGDIGRTVPPFRADNDSLFFSSLNRSKRSVCLDLVDSRGRQVLEDLVAVSDAVYSSLRGDVPGKLRLHHADLAHRNPLIVCCTLTGYGTNGPRAAQPGFDYMVQGMAGWMSITGDPAGPPTKAGLSAVDFSTGIVAALATMAGVHAARRDGVGSDCDISLLDTALSMLNYLATWTGTQGYEPRRVERSGHPSVVPFGAFPTLDGWLIAGGSKEKFWRRMAIAMERADLLQDPRFTSFEDRLVNKQAFMDEVDRTLSQRPTAHWLTVLEEAGVPCGPVNSVAEAMQDPQVIARNLVFEVEQPAFGAVTQVASPVRVGQEPHRRQPAPALGEHTRAVLQGLLGYSESRVEALAEAGVVRGPGLPEPPSG